MWKVRSLRRMNVWKQSSVKETAKTYHNYLAKPLLKCGAVEKIYNIETGLSPPPLLGKWAVEKMLVSVYRRCTVQEIVQAGCIPPLPKWGRGV